MSTTETATAFGDDELRRATNNFSESTKLAEGSFGVVYRGRIDDGREVETDADRVIGLPAEDFQFQSDGEVGWVGFGGRAHLPGVGNLRLDQPGLLPGPLACGHFPEMRTGRGKIIGEERRAGNR